MILIFILNFVAPIGGAEDGSGTMNDIEKLKCIH